MWCITTTINYINRIIRAKRHLSPRSMGDLKFYKMKGCLKIKENYSLPHPHVLYQTSKISLLMNKIQRDLDYHHATRDNQFAFWFQSFQTIKDIFIQNGIILYIFCNNLLLTQYCIHLSIARVINFHHHFLAVVKKIFKCIVSLSHSIRLA